MTKEEFINKWKYQSSQEYGSALFDFSEQLSKDLESVIENCNNPDVGNSFCICGTALKEQHYSYGVPVCFKCNRVVKMKNI